MKVILLEDVKSLGKKGEVVNVSDGYARNMILPKKLGIEANGKNMNDLKLKNQHEEIASKEVVVKLKTGEGGRTFGSVSSKEIAAAAKEQIKIELDKKKIQLPDGGLKTLGVHEVSIKFHPKVTGKLKVKIEEE